MARRHAKLVWRAGVASLLALFPRAASGAERTVLIVAGQSNALNWHADAAAVPANPADGRIAFYYHTGAPPRKGGLVNATSDGGWKTLGPQRQQPYVRYARDFFGPEIGLGRALAAQGESSLAIIKIAYFGTNLAEDWRPDATSGNRLYALMTDEVTRALRALEAQGDRIQVRGFFWMQGETDAAKPDHAAAYENNLIAFIARVRRDFGDAADPLPFVIGRIGPPPVKSYPHEGVVRRAQVRVASSMPAVAWVDTDDLRRDTDAVHLLAPGVLTLGERWAAAWLKLRPR